MWFIGVEEEQETSAPPPKKNPGSAPEKHIRTSAYNHRSSECALLRTGTLLHCTWLIVKHSTRKGKTNLTEFNFFIWPSCVKPRKTKYSKRPQCRTNIWPVHFTYTLPHWLWHPALQLTWNRVFWFLRSSLAPLLLTCEYNRFSSLFVPLTGGVRWEKTKDNRSQRQNVIGAGYADSN